MAQDEAEPFSPEAEALELLVKAWLARDFVDQHAGELNSADPCEACLGVARAVIRGRKGALEELACGDVRLARAAIEAAATAVKKTTGDIIR